MIISGEDYYSHPQYALVGEVLCKGLVPYGHLSVHFCLLFGVLVQIIFWHSCWRHIMSVPSVITRRYKHREMFLFLWSLKYFTTLFYYVHLDMEAVFANMSRRNGLYNLTFILVVVFCYGLCCAKKFP